MKIKFFYSLIFLLEGTNSEGKFPTNSTIPSGSHYDWKDGIVILDTSNFMQIYDSETMWVRVLKFKNLMF